MKNLTPSLKITPGSVNRFSSSLEFSRLSADSLVGPARAGTGIRVAKKGLNQSLKNKTCRNVNKQLRVRESPFSAAGDATPVLSSTRTPSQTERKDWAAVAYGFGTSWNTSAADRSRAISRAAQPERPYRLRCCSCADAARMKFDPNSPSQAIVQTVTESWRFGPPP